MKNIQIQLITDGDGLALLGDPAAIERFLASAGLESRDVGLPSLGTVLESGCAAVQAGSEIAANAGRWVKLTPKSAAALKKYEAMKGSSADVSRALLTQEGKTKHILEFAKTPGRSSPIQRSWQVLLESGRSWRCNRPWTKSPTTSP